MFSEIIGFIKQVYSFPVRNWTGRCIDNEPPSKEWVERLESVGIEYEPYAPSNCEANYGIYEPPDRVIAVISGLFIYGITLIVLGLIASYAWKEVSWRRNRVECQHCGTWTLGRSDGEHPACLNDQGCCDDCFEVHLDDEVRDRANTEAVLPCPHCSTSMTKQIEHRVIIDVCDNCGCVVLTGPERELLEQIIADVNYEHGYSRGRSAQRSTNSLAMGIAIGSVINS